jgi:hypothetical protein
MENRRKPAQHKENKRQKKNNTIIKIIKRQNVGYDDIFICLLV